MANKDFNDSLQSGNLPDDVSSLLDLLRTQEEYHRDELIRVKRLRQRIESLIPDSYNHLFNQINDILEQYDDNGNGAATDQG